MNYVEPQFRTKVTQDFWPKAEEARAKFENFVSSPWGHTFDGPHQCWDYWYAPPLYYYLRTKAARILGDELIADFMQQLAGLGLDGLTPSVPWLTVHLNGMYHRLHNDALNGTYAYIYSLTRDTNHFTGGETLVIREPGVFEPKEPRHNCAWNGFYEVHPPHFNQLILFDDRLAHEVPVVQGTINLMHGRVCLTGHFR